MPGAVEIAAFGVKRKASQKSKGKSQKSKVFQPGVSALRRIRAGGVRMLNGADFLDAPHF
jgi:hypothetical protein